MHRIRSYYYQHKNAIWITILFTFLVIVGIQLLNKYTHDEAIKRGELNRNSVNSSTNTTTVNKKEKESVISGGSISNSQAVKNKEAITAFVEYCNNRDLESAYNMLTDECKEKFFPSIEDFLYNYYVEVFKEYRICDMQVWVANNKWYTYRITLMDDMLASGTTEKTGVFTDYYTVVQTEEGVEKLNINQYIGRKNIDKKSSTNNISIAILSKDVYLDYEVYNVEIQNKTANTILVDSKRKTDTIFLTDENDVEYRAYMYEIDDAFLKIEGYMSRKFSIKFNRKYNPNRVIKKVNFMDVVLDYNEYIENPDAYDSVEKIAIPI